MTIPYRGALRGLKDTRFAIDLPCSNMPPGDTTSNARAPKRQAKR